MMNTGVEGANEPREDVFSKAFLPLVCISGVAFVLFIVGVCLFSFFGERYADRLSGEIGELQSQHAQALAEIGQTENAIAAYEKALALRFDDPRQRGWTLRRLGRLLLQEERAADALPYLQECIAAYPEDLVAQDLHASALRLTKQYAALVTAAQAWEAQARGQGNAHNQSLAQYSLGMAYEGLEKPEEALAAYLQGHALEASGVNAYHAATMAYKLGDYERALELVDAYLEVGVGWRLKSAKRLRRQIESARQS